MPLTLKTTSDTLTITDALLVPEGAKDVTFTIRHITIEKNREVQRKYTTKVPNRRTHQRDDVIDWEAVTDELLDYALEDWSGIEFNGKPAPCDSEHKALLDGIRRAAILERAGMNEVQMAPEHRERSFRTTADVR